MTTKPTPVLRPCAGLTDENGIYYPDSDGEPLADGRFQDPLFRYIVSAMETHFADQPNTLVSGNTMVYYQEGNPRVFVSPDCYVAFDVDQELILYHNTYRIWAVGKPPDFVLEIASESTAERDIAEKRDLYAEIGIPEYWRYDSTEDSRHYGEPLVGERLMDGEYQRLEVVQEPGGLIRGHSPMLNLDLCWDAGRLWFYDPVTGTWLLNQREEQSGRLEAEARADFAEARMAEMEAELRRLRGE